ncbi:MAG TPA: hypothetical protein VMV92_43725, partial [Streptosporangiaceae bacterium]|nr:hypothetical protein [Streptosporangiaceae bacterium]
MSSASAHQHPGEAVLLPGIGHRLADGAQSREPRIEQDGIAGRPAFQCMPAGEHPVADPQQTRRDCRGPGSVQLRYVGYLHASEDHELIHRAGTLRDAAERTDTEIIADWCRALDALFAHGVEDALPPGADPAPLDFAGIGIYPILKLLEQHGTATAEILSAEIGEGATERMTPSSGRLRWSAWTARYGDPTAAFLRLAAEFGAVTVDGPAVSLTPLGAWAVIHQVGAKVEVLPASAALTPIQLIICRLGMSGETFEQELHAWLAAREAAGAVTALLEAAAEEDAAYLTTGVQIAAGIEGDTEAAWLSAMSLPAIRPYAVAELNRRAGR